MTWKNITLEQFLQIQDILENEENVYIKIATLLTGKDQNEVPILEVRKNIDSLKFLKEAVPVEKLKSTYKIKDTVYKLDIDLDKITTAQYLDYLQYSKNKNDIAKLVSVFFIPKGKKYNEGYNKLEVIKDIEENLDIVTVNSIAFFLQKQIRNYLKGLIVCSVKKLKKQNKPYNQLQTLYRLMGC